MPDLQVETESAHGWVFLRVHNGNPDQPWAILTLTEMVEDKQQCLDVAAALTDWIARG